MKKSAILCLLALSLMLAGCHMRGGEPSQSELFSALEDQLEHTNDRGGVKINMGMAPVAGVLSNKLTFLPTLQTALP